MSSLYKKLNWDDSQKERQRGVHKKFQILIYDCPGQDEACNWIGGDKWCKMVFTTWLSKPKYLQSGVPVFGSWKIFGLPRSQNKKGGKCFPNLSPTLSESLGLGTCTLWAGVQGKLFRQFAMKDKFGNHGLQLIPYWEVVGSLLNAKLILGVRTVKKSKGKLKRYIKTTLYTFFS